MQNVLRILQAIALAALIAVLGEAAWTIHFLRPKLAVTVSNTDRAVIAVGAAAGNLEKASRAWQQSSKEQSSETTQAMSNVSAAAKQLSTFISRTDNSVNALLLPTLTNAIAQENQSLLETQKNLQVSLFQTQQGIVEAQKVLSDADAQIANPAVKESVDNLAATTQNTAELTAHAAGTMKAVQSGVEYEVAEIEKPISKIKAVLLTIVKAAGIFFGY